MDELKSALVPTSSPLHGSAAELSWFPGKNVCEKLFPGKYFLENRYCCFFEIVSLSRKLCFSMGDVVGEIKNVPRKFGIKFSQHHDNAEEVRMRFIQVKSMVEWNAVLDEYY